MIILAERCWYHRRKYNFFQHRSTDFPNWKAEINLTGSINNIIQGMFKGKRDSK